MRAFGRLRAAGYLALVVAGLRTAPAVTQAGLTGPRIVVAVLSLAVTALVLQALHVPHPPVGATTLIVGLGLLTTPGQLGAVVLSVLLVTALAVAVNRLAGVRQLAAQG